MSDLRLNRLRLRNFKGVSSFDLEPGGGDAAIFGDNAAGKTTLADAWSWLLFGKDSSGASQFEIKTLDETGEPAHNLEHEVEAEITPPSGESRTLRKVYHEVWTKRRGSAQREFSGHTTDHFVDGVPCKQLEYAATVAEIAEESTWQLLTDPTAFAERLHWQERRKLLLEVCGDVPDSDVIASRDELSELGEILDKRSIDDHRKVVTARRQEINKELDRVPVRISEAERGRPDVGDLVEKDLASELEDLRSKREVAAEKRAALRAGGAVAEKTKELREAESRCQELETRARRAQEEELAALRRVAVEAEEARDVAVRKALSLETDVDEAEKTVKRLEGEMEALREEWHRLDGLAFEHESETSCPTCGQDLPEEAVKAAHEKALAAHNEKKAFALKKISADGKELAKKRDALAAKAAAARKQRTAFDAELVALKDRASEARSAVPTEIADSPWLVDAKWQAAQEERQRIEASIAELQQAAAPALEEVDVELAELDDLISNAQAGLARFEAGRQADARVQELKEQERTLGAEFERLEHELWLLDEFTRQKVDLLEERINARFQMARFKLFDQQVNGGIAETCQVSYGGVPWGSLNHGARIQVGLDVIRTLQEHFGIAVPVFVDQGESVTTLPEMDCQLFRLVVSASDQQLRVEVEAPALEVSA